MKKHKHHIFFGIIIILLLVLLTFSLFYTPKSTKAENHYLLGKAYESHGYFDKAKVSYAKSIELKEDSIVYNALGNLYEYLGDDIAAASMFERGTIIDKTDIENFFDLSRVYIDLKEYDKAEENLILIAKDNPNPASIYSLLGTVYIETNECDKAEDILKKSLALQEMPSTHNDLGVVYENLGDYGLAIESYEHALMLDPNFELARNNLERLL